MATPPPISTLQLEGMLEGGELRPDKLIQTLNQFTQPTHQALSKGLTFSANFRATVKDIRFTMPSEPPWRVVGATAQPAFEGGWVNSDTASYGSASFCMFPGGRVEIIGVIKDGGGQAFTLPIGYRPPKQKNFAVMADINSTETLGDLLIDANGLVVPYLTNLDFCIACSFIAASPAAPTAFFGTYGGNQWPLVVSHQLPSRCTGLLPLACQMKDAKASDGIGNYSVDWEDKGDGNIRIKSIWGLQWAKTYTLKVLLLAE